MAIAMVKVPIPYNRPCSFCLKTLKRLTTLPLMSTSFTFKIDLYINLNKSAIFTSSSMKFFRMARFNTSFVRLILIIGIVILLVMTYKNYNSAIETLKNAEQQILKEEEESRNYKENEKVCRFILKFFDFKHIDYVIRELTFSTRLCSSGLVTLPARKFRVCSNI